VLACERLVQRDATDGEETLLEEMEMGVRVEIDEHIVHCREHHLA